jgi:hypothetical protein
MTAPIIHLENIQCPWIVLSKLIQKDLEVDGIHLGEFQEKTFSGGWFNGPIHIEILKALLHETQWFHSDQGELAPLNREEAKATFILAKDAHRALSRS